MVLKLRLVLIILEPINDFHGLGEFKMMSYCEISVLLLRSGADSSNAMLVAGAFTISHIKCQKRSLLKEFRGPFGFFCMECRAEAF
jgi:hypothetical protein